jgi:DNA-binding MarR family transcriptional regulator
MTRKMADPLAEFPGYALRRASNAMMGLLSKRLNALRLSTTDASILILIHANVNLKQTELCRLLDIKPANMTPRIARMEATGMIFRAKIDGRSNGLMLTPTGEELRRDAWEIMHDHETKLMARVAPEDADHLVPALRTLSA